MAKNDAEKLEAWRPGNHLYEKDEHVRHNGKTFLCKDNHYGIDDTEPGVGSFWNPFWNMVEVAGFSSIGKELAPWRVNEKLYFKGEEVLHAGRRFGCRETHYSGLITEPKKGMRWFDYWNLIEEVEFPEADVSKRLSFVKPTDKTEYPWKGARQNDSGSFYEVNDTVEHDATGYRCVRRHWSEDDNEPGKGDYWPLFWEEAIKTPAAPTGVYFVPSGPDSMEEINLERLVELVESGECNISFELKQDDHKPIRVAQMELIEIEETEEGTIAHFRVLRDLTDGEEE